MIMRKRSTGSILPAGQTSEVSENVDEQLPLKVREKAVYSPSAFPLGKPQDSSRSLRMQSIGSQEF